MKTSVLFLLAGLLCQKSAAQTGVLDPSFSTTGYRVENYGYSSSVIHGGALQPDGKAVLVGEFETNSSTSRMALVRLMPDGSLDSAFGANGFSRLLSSNQSSGKAAVILPDGKIVVGGHMERVDPISQKVQIDLLITRFRPDGSIDSSFAENGEFAFDFSGLGGTERISELFLQPDGGMVAVENSVLPTLDSSRIVLIKLDPDGKLDSAFGKGGVAASPSVQGYTATWIPAVQQSDGKFLAGTCFSSTMGLDGGFRFFRFDADGTLDVSFGTGGQIDFNPNAFDDMIQHMALQKDGKIIFSGFTSNFNTGIPYWHFIARLKSDGSADSTFNGSGILNLSTLSGWGNSASDMAVQEDGSILLSDYYAKLMKLNTDGSVGGISKAGFPADSRTEKLLLGPDGKVLLTAWFDGSQIGAARFLPSLQADSTFSADGLAIHKLANGDDRFVAIAVQPDGRVVAVGKTFLDWEDKITVACYLGYGKPDPNFINDGIQYIFFYASDQCSDVAILPKNDILIAGWQTIFNSYPYITGFALARLDDGGWPDTNFDTDGFVTVPFSPGEPSKCHTVAVLPNKKILAGGEAAVNGFVLMRFTEKGRLDSTLVGGTGKLAVPFPGFYGNSLNDLQLMSDGRFVGLGHGTAGATGKRCALITRFQPDGSLDPTFGGDGCVELLLNGDLEPRSVAVAPDGRLTVAGTFVDAGVEKIFVARLMADGSFDNGFGANGWTLLGGAADPRSVAAVALQADHKILLAGRANGGAMLVRLKSDGQVDNGFAPDGALQLNTNGRSLGMALQPNGKVLVVGEDLRAIDTDAFIARILPGPVVKLAEKEAARIGLYVSPNPVIGRIFLGFNLEKATEAEAFLTDAQGRIVMDIFSKKEYPSGETRVEIDTAKLAAGAYWLVLETGTERAAVKFLKL